MTKDKEWLKGIVEGSWRSADGGASIPLEDILYLIDQLDEPKGVPEEEFERLFEDHQKLAHELDDMKLRYGSDKYVKIALERGQQLLKIQSERDRAEKELRELKDTQLRKVVVPAFVAEWIEECKRGFKSLYGALKGPGGDGKLEEWLFISPNQKTLARAWLDGYEVEKEKKYVIKIGNLYMAEPLGDMARDVVWMTRNKNVAYRFKEKESINTHLNSFEGTEAVPVEEMEE